MAACIVLAAESAGYNGGNRSDAFELRCARRPLCRSGWFARRISAGGVFRRIGSRAIIPGGKSARFHLHQAADANRGRGFPDDLVFFSSAATAPVLLRIPDLVSNSRRPVAHRLAAMAWPVAIGAFRIRKLLAAGPHCVLARPANWSETWPDLDRGVADRSFDPDLADARGVGGIACVHADHQPSAGAHLHHTAA